MAHLTAGMDAYFYCCLNRNCNTSPPQRHHHHDDHQAHSHGHAHGHFGDEDTDNYHLKTFLTGQYAPVDELMMYPFVPREALDFHRKCADLCIKHKQVFIK